MKTRRTTSKTSSSPPPTTQHRRRKSAADRILPILPLPSISSPLAHSLPKTFCTPPPPHSLSTSQARVPTVLLHVRTKTSPFCRTNNTRRVDPVLSCKACDMMIHRSFFKSTNLVSLLVTSRLHFDQSTSERLFSTPVRMIATSYVFLYVMLYLVFVLNNFFVRKIKGQGFE